MTLFIANTIFQQTVFNFKMWDLKKNPEKSGIFSGK